MDETPRAMQAAYSFLEWESALPSDLWERIESVPLSAMTREQAATLVTVARLYGWKGESDMGSGPATSTILRLLEAGGFCPWCSALAGGTPTVCEDRTRVLRPER